MATSNTNIANISFINENLGTVYPKLAAQWQKLRGRALVYGNDSNYKSFTASWFTNENTNRVFREIRRGIGALKEVENNNALSAEQKQKIKDDIQLTIDVELGFLDLKQQIKLAKDQNQFRPEINELNLYLKSKTRDVRTILKESNMPEGVKPNVAPEIYRFYKRSKRFNLNFDAYVAFATTSRDLLELGHHGAKIVDSATQLSTMALQAIPALYAITVAGTFAINAARSWWNHQSPRKKALSTGLAIAAIGVIAISGTLPAVGVFITGTLAVLGTFMDKIKPTIDLFRLIKAKEDELALTESKIEKLSESNSLTIRLDQKDVTAIQRKLEDYLGHTQVKPEDIIALRKLMSEPDITVEKLANNALLQAATHTKNPDDLRAFIIHAAHAHTDTLKDDIKTLKAQRQKSTTLATNGFLSAVGAILCCIPTPPTVLAGVSILAFTTAINIVVTYDVIPKAINFFKNIFGGENKTDVKPVAKTETANEIKLSTEMKNMHSSLNTQERKPSQEATIQPDKSRDLFQKPRPVVVNNPVIEPEIKRKMGD